MKIQVVNQKNKKVSDIDVKDFTEDGKVNKQVLAQYIYIYLANKRSAAAKTKDRAEVSGGGKKPFAQKGTGNARAGSNRSPIWRGGGISFGPTGEQNYKKKTTKNFRRSAFQNAISKSFAEGTLKLVEEVKFDKETLTKQAAEMLKDFENPKKVVLVTLEKNEDAIKAFSNLKNARVIMVNRINPHDLISGETVIVEQKAMEFISQKWGNN